MLKCSTVFSIRNGHCFSKEKKGARFRLVVDEDKPHVSTVVWEFENAKIQKDIEAIIAQEIVRFTKALPNKEMHFQGEVELDFNEA